VNEQLEVEAKARWVRRSLPGIILTPGERFPQGGESTVREDQHAHGYASYFFTPRAVKLLEG
jgi:hypothetical protein